MLVVYRGYLASFMVRILVKVFHVLDAGFTDNHWKSLVAYIIAGISVSLQQVLNNWSNYLEKSQLWLFGAEPTHFVSELLMTLLCITGQCRIHCTNVSLQ